MNAASASGFVLFAACAVAIVAGELGYTAVMHIARGICWIAAATLVALLITEGP